MSTFDAALRSQQPPATRGPRTKVVEVWEVERWKFGEGWTDPTWCDAEGVAYAETQVEMQPPAGYAWDGPWTIVPPEEEHTGAAPWQGFGAWGWEYATSTKKLGARAPRRGFAFDRARRRRWQRKASRTKESGRVVRRSGGESSASARQPQQQQQQRRRQMSSRGVFSEEDRTLLVRRQLEEVQRLRREVEAKAKLCGTPHDTVELRRELDAAAMRAGQLSSDVGKLLDSSVAAPLGSKLSRDLYKEVAAVSAVVRQLPPFRPWARDSGVEPGGRAGERVATGRGALAPPSSSFDVVVDPHDSRTQGGGEAADDRPGPRQRLQRVVQEQKISAEEEEARRIARNVRSVSEQAVIESIEEETYEAVQDIHKSIFQINDIVKDLAMQVESQQELIDAVGANTLHAHEKVTSARQQVVQAAQIQASTPCVIS